MRVECFKDRVNFDLRIKVLPKQSFRTYKHASGGYASKKVVENKKLIQYELKRLMILKDNWSMLKGPLCLYAAFLYPGRGTSRKQLIKYERTPKTTKPDIDNVLKQLLDSFQGLLFEDDSAVCRVHATKWYWECSYAVVGTLCNLDTIPERGLY